MNPNEEPTGLGGWLVLTMLGLLIFPLRSGALLATTFYPIFTSGSWTALTTPGSEAYHVLWAPLLLFEMAGNVLFLASSLVLLVLFFHKHYLFPRFMIVFMLANVAFIGVDLSLAGLIPGLADKSDTESDTELARSLVGAAIWIPYFLKSVRVRNTFKEGRPERDRAVA